MLTTHFSLAELPVLPGCAVDVPLCTRVSTRFNRVHEHSSPVNVARTLTSVLVTVGGGADSCGGGDRGDGGGQRNPLGFLCKLHVLFTALYAKWAYC